MLKLALSLAAMYSACTALLHNYSVSTFNQLPHLEQIRYYQVENAEEMKVVRQLYLDWNVHQKIGLFLLHKHFDLNAGEKVIEMVAENISIAMPMDSQQATEANLTKNVIPYRFQLTQTGGLVPLEYTLSDNAGSGVLSNRFNALLKEGPFLQQLALTLDEMGLLTAFGVGYNSRDFVSNQGTQEISNGVDRVLTTTKKSNENESEPELDEQSKITATVGWMFIKIGQETDVCSLHSQCDHCIGPHHIRTGPPIPAPTPSTFATNKF